VGTVWLAWCAQSRPPQARCHVFPGDRAAVRAQTCQAALEGLLTMMLDA
jgi:nicotinamide-nucleotide amidase